MGIFDAADAAGKAVQMKREEEKILQQTKDEAIEEAKKEAAQHEENKRQGMI